MKAQVRLRRRRSRTRSTPRRPRSRPGVATAAPLTPIAGERPPAEDQERREDDVDDHRCRSARYMPGLKLPVPRSAAPIATIANCSAMAGMNHEQVLLGARCACLRSALWLRGVRCRSSHRRHQEQPAGDHRQHLRLVEQENRALVVLASRRVRHQRRGADAEHLRDREHDERQVAADARPPRSASVPRRARPRTDRPGRTASGRPC